jgi:hypothetical protein
MVNSDLTHLLTSWSNQSTVDQGTMVLLIIVIGCALLMAFAGIIDSLRRKPVPRQQYIAPQLPPSRKSKTLAKSFRDYGTRVRHTKIRIK